MARWHAQWPAATAALDAFAPDTYETVRAVTQRAPTDDCVREVLRAGLTRATEGVFAREDAAFLAVAWAAGTARSRSPRAPVVTGVTGNAHGGASVAVAVAVGVTGSAPPSPSTSPSTSPPTSRETSPTRSPSPAPVTFWERRAAKRRGPHLGIFWERRAVKRAARSLSRISV